ncbi:MAG: carboxypeptidase-like regulatory domain-containing protein [bacterium]
MRNLINILLILTYLIPQVISAQETSVHIEENQLFTLEEIFEVIKSQTEYEFVYPSSILDNPKTIPVEQGDIIIRDLLSLGLATIDCAFEFNENTIIVKRKIDKEDTIKLITGRITYQEEPIEDVHILVRSKKGTRTNINGYYQIHASIGDVIRFSHVSFKPLEIIVEDVTKILNIEMAENSNQLEEAVITVEKSGSISKTYKSQHRKVKTAFGELQPMLLPSRVRYLAGEQVKFYPTLRQAIEARITVGAPTIFDIDGEIYYDESILKMDNIVDVYIVSGSAATVRWGGPVAIVTTKDGIGSREKQLSKIEESYRNQNYYQDDAAPLKEELITSSDTKQESNEIQLKEISGKITYEGSPLPDTHIRIIGTPNGVNTNEKGKYTIMAKEGDELRFSYVGFHTVSVIIEDITKQVDVIMIPSTNSLDEVVITAKTKFGTIIDRSKKQNVTFETSRDATSKTRSANRMNFIDQSELNQGAVSLSDAIIGKVSGVRREPRTGKLIINGPPPMFPYPIWDVDGQILTNEPNIDPKQVASVYIIKSPGNKYGPIGNGGIIVVKTIATTINSSILNSSNVTNNNFYRNDAVTLTEGYIDGDSEYITLLKKYRNRAYAYLYYENTLKNKITSYSDHISVARLFKNYFDDQFKATKILVQLSKEHDDHPEILKAIGYNLQAIGEHREAVKVYQNVFKLRTTYAQSYRDLANAYKENNQFKKSWRMYLSYLMQGHKADYEGIGETIYNEMEYLFFARPNQTQIKERFEPRSEDLFDFRNDVRFVIEWNTSEAEFDLEFVAPDRRSYVFEHTLVANQDLINFEKTSGFSSKEFFIDDIGDGEWLMNLTYFGNKKTAPTYFKITLYYNWGKANQKQENLVFKLDNQREKLQLKRINKQSLLFAN